jgi:hypothetical protein
MLVIRAAQPEDVGTILKLIRGLAEYEHEPQAAQATEEDLLRDGFGAEPKFHCVLAEWEGAAVGFALYFYNYSTWKGRPGIFLRHLCVAGISRQGYWKGVAAARSTGSRGSELWPL